MKTMNHVCHLLDNLFSHPFPPNLQNIINHKAARELKFLNNVHHPMCVMCHMSLVTCHVSHVIYRMSHVTLFFFLHIGLDSWWRVCYQRGLPCLVSL